MDALKSGAIFRLKNMAVVRSPPAVSISKPDDPVVAKVTVDESRNAGPTTLSDEASVIKRRFDEIYRSTPTPAAMLNRSYHWDQGNNLSAPGSSQTKLDNPSSSSSAQLSGMYYQPYRPPPSMQYYDQSIQFQHRSAYRSATMPPPMLPPSSIQSHQSIDSPTQDIQDSSPQPKISPIRSYSEIDSIDRNSGSKGRLKSRGRLGGPNTLMNLTMSKTASMPSPPPVSSSSSSKGQSMKSPSHSMTSSPVRGSTKALSFMSGMSQTKRRRSPSGKLLSSSGSSSYSEAPIIEKRIDDRKRFGSLTLVPLVSLRSGSSPNRLYSDDSSSSSDSSDSEIDTRKRVQSPSKSPSRVAISAKQVRLTLGGRLRKMSDVIAESVRATVRTEEVTSPLEEAAGNCAASAEVTATIIAQSAPSSSSKSKGLQLSNMDVNYTASAEDTDLPSDTLEPISLDSPVVGMSDTLEPISLDSPVVGIIPSQASGTDEEHPPQKRVRAPSKAKGGTKARKITKIDQTRQQTNSEENGIEPVIAAVVVDTLASNSSSGPRSVAVVSTEWLPEEVRAAHEPSFTSVLTSSERTTISLPTSSINLNILKQRHFVILFLQEVESITSQSLPF